ncbi:glycosyltransferase family 28 protein [Oesophagostomum dentatum]|uniref:UDP-glucuronosyltransferase n=1 Tax=Oesophagostomum dentatum TaxID=61180 RepID=A0A0B1SZV6_OESDE|nr:glycosyltransferase family 28 protein [Oesophagostomum dentatum]
MEGTSYAIGAPVIPSFMPASQGVTDDSTTFANRVVNMMFTATSWYFQVAAASVVEDVMVEKLGNSVTPIWAVVSNISFILTNTEPLLEFARPTLHNIVDIGGISVHEPKPLDEKWNSILDLRHRNVLLSFGSVASCKFMPLEMKTAIVETIKSFPDVTFIWKYEEPEDAPFAHGVENLFLSKWTPQNDLLADDRLTVFVTHGGAGSLLESATRGKPMIVVPLFGDQTRNAKLIVKFGLGIMLNKQDLFDSNEMSKAIGEILNDKSYQNAAHRIRDLLANQSSWRERKLLKTVEMVAEFGEMPELRVAGRNLGIIAYYNLDIWLMTAIVLTFVVYLLLLIIRLLFGRFLGSTGRMIKIKTH